MHHDQQIMTSLQESVMHYATCAQKAGLDGAVCSAHEADQTKDNGCLHTRLHDQPAVKLVIKNDHDTCTSSKQATMIVVGRPITI